MRSALTTRLANSSSRGLKCTSILTLVLCTTTVFCPFRVLLGQSAQYIVTELTGEDATQVPSKLNNLGDIVGRNVGAEEGAPRATLWGHSNSKSKHLGVLPHGDYSSATGINDAGEIVGVSNTGTAIVPFIWSEKNGLQRLPLFRGDNCGQAVAINKHGDVGCYSSGPNGCKAYVWSRKTGVRDLNILPGGSYSRAHGINDSGELVGISSSPDGDRAVLWAKSGSVRDLGTLPGDLSSEALAINNAGDVVGYSKGPRGMRAFLWTKVGGMQALGVLAGGDSSRALDISDLGEVVGSSTSASGDRAFIWTKEAGLVDLNSADTANLGVVLIEAHAINSKGQIIAMGRNGHETMSSQNEICAPAPPLSFVLTPIATSR
jgi:probable HAF family extracellular repeat protein